MATTKDEAPSVQISIRVEPQLVDRVDDLIEFVGKRTGLRAKRADVWREAIIIGLREMEKLEKKGGGR